MLELEGRRPTGELCFEFIQGKTAVTTAYARYPLKFVSTTRAADGGCAWVYALGYGGGAVCGDQVSISCTVGERCTAALTTQGSTKVYKRGSRRAGTSPEGVLDADAYRAVQSLRCRVSRGAMMAVVPDPVTCFEDASFKQHQRFMLEESSSLVLVDWLTSGRMSRGEGWDFARLESRNEVMVQVTQVPSVAGENCEWEPMILDSLVLEELPGFSIRERMLGMNVVGVAILVGPRVSEVVSTVLEGEARKRSSLPAGLQPGVGSHGRRSIRSSNKKNIEVGNGGAEALRQSKGGRVLSSVSRLQGGSTGSCNGLVYRFAAERTEDARKALENLLLPLKASLGGKAAYSTEGGVC